jgi:hypothetical protein
MGICKLCITSQKIIREDDKIWFDSNWRTAIRLRRLYLKNKSDHNHSKFQNQRSKVNNMKKYVKEKYYTEINENLKDIKSSNSIHHEIVCKICTCCIDVGCFIDKLVPIYFFYFLFHKIIISPLVIPNVSSKWFVMVIAAVNRNMCTVMVTNWSVNRYSVRY